MPRPNLTALTRRFRNSLVAAPATIASGARSALRFAHDGMAQASLRLREGTQRRMQAMRQHLASARAALGNHNVPICACYVGTGCVKLAFGDAVSALACAVMALVYGVQALKVLRKPTTAGGE